MAEAYAEDRNLPFKAVDHVQRDPRLIRRARPRGQQNMIRVQLPDAFEVDFIIAANHDLLAQLS
ncbi:hypothetical protein D1872_280430 [compost metagenome]